MLGTIILVLIVILLLVAIIGWFVPTESTNNKKPTEETTDWEYEKRQAKREHEAEKNKEWFKTGRWLTDKEIDWATSRMKDRPMPGSWPGQGVSKFKILPAHQFHYCVEVMRKREKDWDLAFKELLKEINDNTKELVFILINNPNFHWSLLVYETKSKTFYHYDTLRGANWNYGKDLVYELLKKLEVPRHEWDEHFLARHKIGQKNGWECGICVCGIMRKVREKYNGSMGNIELGKIDFSKEQERLREEYLQESN